VNATYSPTANHRFYGAYTNLQLDQLNGSQQNIMDLGSLYNASNPQDLLTFNYNGVLSDKLYVEGRVTGRHWTSSGAGSPFSDLVNGTLLVDRSKGGTTFRYWTSTFCGVCEPECPAEAILPDTEGGLEKWLELNTTFSAQWPNVTRKNDQTPADADEHKGEEGKYDKYFSADPGKGD